MEMFCEGGQVGEYLQICIYDLCYSSSDHNQCRRRVGGDRVGQACVIMGSEPKIGTSQSAQISQVVRFAVIAFVISIQQSCTSSRISMRPVCGLAVYPVGRSDLPIRR
jgi:hypothetical protein